MQSKIKVQVEIKHQGRHGMVAGQLKFEPAHSLATGATTQQFALCETMQRSFTLSLSHMRKMRLSAATHSGFSV